MTTDVRTNKQAGKHPLKQWAWRLAFAGLFLELHAAEYLDRLSRGESGAATAYLGGLRHGSGDRKSVV